MSAARRRPCVGFTLVELLVVMVIIGMLAAIGARVAFSVIETAKVTKISVEISGLETALKAYKNDFGSYPPLLSDRAAVKKHVRRRWPNFRGDQYPESQAKDAAAESLVFWLGSFNTDPERPFKQAEGDTNAGGVEQKTAPRFDFDEQRLAGETPEDKNPRRIQGIKLWRYYPPQSQKPYVYFESRTYDNQDLAYFDELRPYKQARSADADVARVQYVNPDGIQIICAGLDNEFGNNRGPEVGIFPTGPYDTNSGGTDRGDDNITNFAGKTLADAKP